MATSRLAYWRKRRGLSQQALADMAGITQPALSQMERGTRAPKGLVSALMIAVVLRVKVDAIWPIRPKRPPQPRATRAVTSGAERLRKRS